MSHPSSLQSCETAWARAFRSKLDQVAAQGGDRGRTDLGRAPSRLWLMDADEIERLPIRDFIEAFAAPPGASVRRRVTHSSHGCSGGGEGASAISWSRASAHGVVPPESPCLGRRANSQFPDPERVAWWCFPVRAFAAAAAMLAFLIG